MKNYIVHSFTLVVDVNIDRSIFGCVTVGSKPFDKKYFQYPNSSVTFVELLINYEIFET